MLPDKSWLKQKHQITHQIHLSQKRFLSFYIVLIPLLHDQMFIFLISAYHVHQLVLTLGTKHKVQPRLMGYHFCVCFGINKIKYRMLQEKVLKPRNELALARLGLISARFLNELLVRCLKWGLWFTQSEYILTICSLRLNKLLLFHS